MLGGGVLWPGLDGGGGVPQPGLDGGGGVPQARYGWGASQSGLDGGGGVLGGTPARCGWWGGYLRYPPLDRAA